MVFFGHEAGRSFLPLRKPGGQILQVQGALQARTSLCVCDVHSNLNQDLGDKNFPQNQPAKTSCLSLTVLLNFLTVLLDIGNIVHQQT